MVELPRIDKMLADATSFLLPGIGLPGQGTVVRGLSSLRASGPLFADPGLAGNETGTYRVVLAKKQTGEAVMSVKAGKHKYTQTVEGDLIAGAGVNATTVIQRDDGVLRAKSCIMETLSGGEVVARDEGRFHDVTPLKFGRESIGIPENVVPLTAMPLMFRAGLERGMTRVFPMWFIHIGIVDINAKVERIETINVPAGRMSAYRIRVRPHLGNLPGPIGALATQLDNLAWRLVPPLILHYAVDSPHPMLRFEFPVGPLRWGDNGGIELHASFPMNEKGALEATSLA